MLAGTMVYVNAGKELAKIDSLSGILSPGLIISFALLGLFPLIVRKVLSIYKIKKRRTIVMHRIDEMTAEAPSHGQKALASADCLGSIMILY